jgi:hypothetical protein
MIFLWEMDPTEALFMLWGIAQHILYGQYSTQLLS